MFSALAFGQAAHDQTGQDTAARDKVVVSKPAACAIPLLNALPANGKADLKMPTVKPSANVERDTAMTSKLGLPACEPGLSASRPGEAVKK